LTDHSISIDDAARYRLPRTVLPHRYELRLTPDLPGATFEGECVTELEIVDPTNTIVCNAAGLEVREAWLVDCDGNRIEAEMIHVDDELERLTIELAAVPVGNRWWLHTRFSGVLNDKLAGFYRSSYTDVDGAEQTIATTQFEATDARRAFPCWDEPDLKAVFSVTLVVDEGLTALSNAAEVERSPASAGRVTVRFADTMVMSTYLLAFVVGPLELSDTATTRGGVPVRVAHPHGKGDLSAYALDVAVFCLDWFADYYGIPYPGDKLDLVAIPDFAFGAMENLGCVTFREVLLLVDPEKATQLELQNVTDVIAHELAHMWFGDLVTMKWWNGIWLNEAFATFMEMLATDAYRPDWQRWTSFALSRSAAFDVDALTSTRPVEFPVVSPADAEGMFDLLTYEKGAAVLRMLEQYLGVDAFREGVRRYLVAHAHGNTETSDLWEALEDATGQPVRRIADSWILQGGFPVVRAEIVSDHSELSEPHVVRLTQSPCRYQGDLGDGEAHHLDERRWAAPIMVSVRSEGVVRFEKVLLDDTSSDLTLFEPPDWVLVNTEGAGYYRGDYPTELLASLASHADTDLSAVERFGLLDDHWAAVLGGRANAVEHLDLVLGRRAEADLSVWQRVVTSLRALDRLLDDDDSRHILAQRVATLIGPALERIGGEPDPSDDDRTRQVRGVLFEALGGLGADPAAALRARDLLEADDAGATVDPGLLAAAVNVVAATGGAAEFEGFLDRSRQAATPQAEQRFLMALADFDDVELVERTVVACLGDDVRTQNAPYLLRRALHNRNHGAHVWFLVQSEWARINERFPSNSIARMLEGIRTLTRPDVAQSIYEFFATHQVPQGDKILAQHLERLEVNVALRARDGHALSHHLRHGR
jgi:puromycin-sensitive aminopeptidase